MFGRTTKLIAALVLGAPAAGWAHAGGVPHVHPHEAPMVALVLALIVAGTLALWKRSASASR